MEAIAYLPKWTVHECEVMGGAYHVAATYDEQPEHCTSCGCGERLYRHGTRRQIYMDAPVHRRKTFIQVKRGRFRCRRCGGTFMQPLPDMDDAHRMTVRCRDYIAEQSLIRPNTHVADTIGVDEKVVRQVFQKHSGNFEADHLRDLRAPRILGIGTLQIGPRLRAILTDVEASEPIEVLSSRSGNSLGQFLRQLPGREKTEFVIIEMFKPHRDAVNVAMPQAAVVVDKGHAIRFVDDLVATGKSCRAELSNNNSTFNVEVALDIAEAFKGIWKLRTAKTAKDALGDWRGSVPEDLYRLFQPAISATKKLEVEILNYFEFRRLAHASKETWKQTARFKTYINTGLSFDTIRQKALIDKKRGRKPEVAVRRKSQKLGMMEQCECCERLFDQRIVSTHHIVPLSEGGGEEADNRLRLCPNCHRLEAEKWFGGNGYLKKSSERAVAK
ncbi:transposase [Tropicimonas sp. TH_r6]|uniref:transposase n=1 Tax=Tropicimonas sp. TH_r6 TaxID=3082085 RepID=UPI002954A46C|nr:transposase [Tropicimonas sp. TH_r6]MDV7143033.1 transposase [Tropicimonas sp. TH_r6]